ncbi:GntR family transcriptional regulator [Aureimonas frigidaquae]|uniref:GntR family transcriptional regulator n=1 Tax=Aureimonas frigidaquae TaxID=424757 RepID=UPI000785BA3F|nr:GntR family transcriptional regulator [Aureimonas frigidaquae]
MKDDQVHEIMSRILASGVIAPGTKLAEQHLADRFGISRDRMRRILHRLGHEGRLALVPNRGARVIDPGHADARIVYEARRVLEGGIAFSITERITPDEIEALASLHAQERDAIERGDDAAAMRLGGALHLGLAELTHNSLIVDTLRSMVHRTSTLLSYFGPRDGPACSCREHSSIIEAVTTRNPMRAREAMCSHLSLVETRLRMRPRCETVDLDTLVRDEIARTVRPVTAAPERADEDQPTPVGAT